MIKFIITNLYYPYIYLKQIYRFFYKYTELRILIFHDIKNHQNDKFFALIKLLQKKWTILSPNELMDFIEKKNQPLGKYLMISFDDGFKSNKNIAKLLNKKFKIKALFFLITNFIKITNDNESLNFAKSKINNYDGDVSNLNVEDINSIIHHDHLLGSHTCDHNLLSSLNKDELNNELINSKKYLENTFNFNCENFAIPYGNITSFNEVTVSEIKKNYKYIFTGLRGNNTDYNKKQYFNRDNIDLDQSIFFNILCIEGFFDWYYMQANKKAFKIFSKNVK